MPGRTGAADRWRCGWRVRKTRSPRFPYQRFDKWVEVADPSGYGCEGDQYNRAQFKPVTTDAMRIEIQLQEKWAGGVHEWRVQ